MFDIWKAVDSQITAQIVKFQREQCSEEIDATKVTADEADICPYQGYRFIRLTYSEQRVWVRSGHPAKRHELGDGTISYLLIKTEGDDSLVELIPLHSDSSDLYAINKRLGLELNAKTVVDYLLFFGLVITANQQSFFFVTNINQISTIRDSLDESARARLDGFLDSYFKINDSGDLDLGLSRKSYPFLGEAFTLTAPAIFDGGAYRAALRVSSSGMPIMDEDEKTTIEGLDEKLPISRRYPLQYPPKVRAKIGRTKAMLQSKIKLISIGLLAERVASILLMPAYILSVIIALYAGLVNDAIYQYYEEIKSLFLLNVGCLLAGTALVFGSGMRFVVVETGALIQKLVPNPLAFFALSVAHTVKAQQKKLGILTFFALGAVEFIGGAFLSLNLFIYGVSNCLNLSFLASDMNFIEVFLLVVLSIPAIGTGADWLLNIGDQVGSYSLYRDSYLMTLSSFVISTFVVGFLVRMFRMGREADK